MFEAHDSLGKRATVGVRREGLREGKRLATATAAQATVVARHGTPGAGLAERHKGKLAVGAKGDFFRDQAAARSTTRGPKDGADWREKSHTQLSV
jgi:hypothetical protein